MPPRKLATITGLLWIATFITSIPAVLLYDPLLNNKDFILGAGGGDTRIFIGATLEILLIVANIGTAVLPYSLFKRYSERLALGFVTARLVESGFIAVGIVSVLAITTLRQDPGGASDGTLVALGQSLVAVHDATFVLGPGIVVGVGNGLILGYLSLRAPRDHLGGVDRHLPDLQGLQGDVARLRREPRHRDRPGARHRRSLNGRATPEGRPGRPSLRARRPRSHSAAARTGRAETLRRAPRRERPPRGDVPPCEQ